jgi:hypothetical protein
MPYILCGLCRTQLFRDGNISTTLTATYNNSLLAVSFVSPDNWTFTLPTGFIFVGGPVFQWLEPGNPSLVNSVNFVTGAVASDVPLNIFGQSAADGIFVPVGTTVASGPVLATFHDNAAAAEASVPDAGTTFSLFGLSLIGLAFVRRQLC